MEPAEVPVIVVGAGFGGLAVSHDLRLRGIEHLVLERADTVGGTWRDNTYPGCACDIPSHLYSLSWAPNPNWSRTFAPAAEIQRYLEDVAVSEGLADRLISGVTVDRAHWDDSAARWRLTTDRGEFTCQALIVAAGGLCEPSLPLIPGLGGFAGPVVHTARWDHTVDLAGARVGVVGTGASAIQVVPSIVDTAASVTVFQRTPAWVFPRRDGKVPRWQQRLFAQVPATARMVRQAQYWRRELVVHAMVTRLGLLERAARAARLRIAAEIHDPALRERLTPDYLPGGKRALLSDDYYPALDRPDVTVVGALAQVDGDTAVTAEGTRVELDALILATGFDVTPPPMSRRVFGLEGVAVSEDWSNRGGAFLGLATAAAPNLFWLTGPNTGLGGNSMIVMIEAQAGYIAQAVAVLVATGDPRAVMAVAEGPQEHYTSWVQRRLATTVWNKGDCTSWYQDEWGRIVAIWPEQTWRFRRYTRRFNPAHYRWRCSFPADASVAARRVGGPDN